MAADNGLEILAYILGMASLETEQARAADHRARARLHGIRRVSPAREKSISPLPRPSGFRRPTEPLSARTDRDLYRASRRIVAAREHAADVAQAGFGVRAVERAFRQGRKFARGPRQQPA